MFLCLKLILLSKVDVPVMDDATAEATYPGINFDTKICIDSIGGHGTCNGDSGGPLMELVGDETGAQVGITSFGSADGCEVGDADCFTSLPYFRDWIQANTGLQLD